MNAIPPHEEFEAEVARLRESGALGRSDVLGRLFDFLAARAREGSPPKESEVALEVFGKQGSFDAMQDASVRVAVLRLRRKLDDHYAGSDVSPRLAIPKGEYRLALTTQLAAEGEAGDDQEAAPAATLPAAGARRQRGLLILALAILLVSALGWTWVLTRNSGDEQVERVRQLAPWAQLDQTQPAYVVVGDYYIFGEAAENGEVTRMVREFDINSKDDLDSYVMMNPAAMGRYVDMGLSYLPRGTAAVLGAIHPVVQGYRQAGNASDHVLSASTLNAQRIKDGNIVYVGWLSGLGLLRDTLFSASNFQIGSTYDELIDKTNGKRFLTDWDQSSQRTRHRDYGYFASFAGPGGKPIIIIAGIRDAGLMQMSDIVTNAAELRRLRAAAGSDSFEALYEVQALDNTSLGSRLVAVHALRTQALWDRDGNPTHFPDQLTPEHRPGQ